MPLKPHPTDPDKMVYVSRQYDMPQPQGVTTTQRPWVDLTDEDIHNTVGYNETREMYQFALALIAKLKEKNSG